MLDMISNSETPIIHLFRIHEQILNEANAYQPTSENEDVEMEELFWNFKDQIEGEMMRRPCTSAADMAAKLLVSHVDGAFSSLSEDHPIWEEARNLVSGKSARGESSR